MKKIICSVVFLMLVNLTTSVGFAQRVNQDRIQKNSTQFSKNVEDTVQFDRVEAYSDGNGVLIKWETGFENDNVGFNIYRIEGKDSIKVNPNIVPGTYLNGGNRSNQGSVYTYFDMEGTFNSVYRIENYNINGKNISSSTFYPRFENDLANIGGQTSEELQNAMRSANPVTIEKNPILPASLKSEVEANSSFSDIDTQKWVAAQPGVKIGIKSEGFYRVTVAELQTAGFDTNSPSANWQLYLNGIQQAINVVEGNYIEFYGKGIDTIDSDVNIYFLVTGPQTGKRITPTLRRGVGGNVVAGNFDFSYKKKERSIYTADILNGDEENFFGAVISSSAPTNVNFSLDGIDFSIPKATVEIKLQGIVNVAHRVQVKLNGEVLEEITGINKNLYGKTLGIPISYLQNGTNTLQFQSLNGASDLSLVGSIQLSYRKLYKANQNSLSFFTRNLRVTNVDGFTSPNVRVFDVSFPDEPRLVSNALIEPTTKMGSEFTAHLPAHRQSLMYAVEDSAIKQVHSITQNFPSTISATTNEADLVIVTNRLWLTEANAWATYRQGQGINVKVIDVEDAFDEFGYGVSGSTALKSFFEFAHNNWQTPPDYIMLMGDGTFDPRNYTGGGFHAYIPTKFFDSLYGEAPSDEAMTDFNNDGLSEIVIGRVPVRNPQTATVILNKVSNFETDSSDGLNRGVLCASDIPNGYDFAGLCGRVMNELPAPVSKTYINRADANAKTELLNTMNAGKFFINYSGHGTTKVWAATSFFGTADVPQLTNQDDLSIFTMLTCLNGKFVETTDSLGETLLNRNGGGAVAVWASSGETTPDIQEIMARRFYGQLGSNPSMVRLGDLVKDAKSVLTGGRDVKLSWVILGDPMLKVK